MFSAFVIFWKSKDSEKEDASTILNWLLTEFALSKEIVSDVSELKVKNDIVFMFVVFRDRKLYEDIFEAYKFNPNTHKCNFLYSFLVYLFYTPPFVFRCNRSSRNYFV